MAQQINSEVNHSMLPEASDRMSLSEKIATIGAGIVGASVVLFGATSLIGIAEVTSGIKVLPSEFYQGGYGISFAGMVGGTALMLAEKKPKNAK